MRRRWRIVLAIVAVLVVALGAYCAYAGIEGSNQLLVKVAAEDCRTPDVQYGWAYEAINYDIADDAQLKARNADLTACTYLGTTAGTDLVTDDGIRLDGWYIPAASGAAPTAPTIVLVHGFKADKSGILHYALGLHPDFNLVVFDMRNVGRSTGDITTAGVLEQKDLRAVIDWLERTKHPSKIGVLGNSLGAITALNESLTDPRVAALALDSMHTRMRYQLEARVAAAGHPPYPATWAIFAAVQLRTGVDIGSIDAEDKLALIDSRPILLTHGTADTEDLPARTQDFYAALVRKGTPAELHWCPGSGHNAPAGMPAEVCKDDFATWTRDFFARTLR